MKNKEVIYILFVSLIGIIVGLILWSFQATSYGLLLTASQNLFFLSAIYLLVKNGAFIKTREYRFLGVSLAVTLIGAMFKLMHWEGGNLMIGSGLASVFIIYVIYFMRKPQKDLLAVGKAVFLLTFLAGKYFKLRHWPKADELSFLSIMILIVVVLYFIQSRGILKEAN